ncbi:MAG: molybdopterin biosynthesis protein [Deltaproteobacteria bacterium]|nr:molybdopterin biosynthesis protein [Deltaproteobacteria bacterium]
MKRNVYLDLKTLKEARDIFNKRWENLKTLPETVDVEDALGRVTAEPVFARISAPSYHAAAMDGIAVRAEDTYGTTEKEPRTLQVGKDAIWINTGQVLPRGYNAVIMVEKIHQIDDEHLEIRATAYPWQNIRKVGEDIVATQLLLPQKHVIRSYDMGALITAGVSRISVRRKPLVTIIPTGTELVDHRDIKGPESLKDGQIIESNSVTLSGLVQESHAIACVKEIIPDNEESIRNELIKAAESEADVVIINAGSSAGSRDYTAGIIAGLGKVHVHGVAMMPGKPTILGEINGKPVIGNPGYIVSSVLSFEQFVKPLLCNLQDLRLKEKQKITVRPSRNIPSKLGTEEFLRVNIGNVGGNAIATPLPRAAGSVTTLTRAEGIIRIPALSEGITQEEEVTAELMVDEEELKNTLVIIGSHDITLDIIADEIRKGGKDIRVSSGNVGSLGGLMAIKKGVCHLGGSHLLDTETGEYNISYINKYLKDIQISVFNLVMRDQGLIVPKGNPKSIMGIDDLIREDITFVNRQAGSGTRILFDYKLKQSGYTSDQVKGYDHEEYTHMAVAVDVLSGAADCGMGIYAAAKALDLDFITMVREQYDLVIPSSHLKNRNIQALIDTIRSKGFRERVHALGGYDPGKSGELWVQLG